MPIFDLLEEFLDKGASSDDPLQTQTQRSVSANREKNRRLEVRYERLKLLTLAMWELMKHKNGMTDADLRLMVAQIDIADGRRDGEAEISEQLADCHNCGRVILTSAPRCPYCHAENESYDPIRAI
ncbi:MAG: hypothetical protein AAF358_19765 [Pseudomonadota bacterium]